MGGYSWSKGFKWLLHGKQMFRLWTFLLQALFSKNDLVIHLILGQKGIIKPIFLTKNGEAGEGEIDTASQETGGNITWVQSGVYFRERKNTLVNRYLRTEWRLPSSRGGKRGKNQEVYSLISATRKGRERNLLETQRGWHISSLQPSKEKWDTEMVTVLLSQWHIRITLWLLRCFLKATKHRGLYLAPFFELLSLFNCGEIVHCCIFDDRQEDKKEADP